MPIQRLLYQSESLITGTETDVRDRVAAIVAAAQCRNERDGLTGALLFVDGLFVQVLEGEVGRLEAAFERICRDLRHRRVVLHEFSEAPERVFAEWAMVAVPWAGKADGLFTPAAGELPRAVRNTALARCPWPDARQISRCSAQCGVKLAAARRRFDRRVRACLSGLRAGPADVPRREYRAGGPGLPRRCVPRNDERTGQSGWPLV